MEEIKNNLICEQMQTTAVPSILAVAASLYSAPTRSSSSRWAIVAASICSSYLLAMGAAKNNIKSKNIT
ncbi:MAG: hypothetical protein WD512_12360, partial [Candidatus Paceibacterota bacterium]